MFPQQRVEGFKPSTRYITLIINSLSSIVFEQLYYLFLYSLKIPSFLIQIKIAKI